MLDLRVPDFLRAGSFEHGLKLDLMKKGVQLVLDLAVAKGAPVISAEHGNGNFFRAADFQAAIGGRSVSEAIPAECSAREQ